ncbi:MAG: hypothetical protein HYY04_08690 [Chloroflexi bacterium]|nr:hypothetical protein [Chloroflexota bacterium]
MRAPTDYAALAYAVVVRLLDVLVEESRGSAPSRAAMAVALRSTVDAEGHLTLAPRSASLGQVEVRVMTNE